MKFETKLWKRTDKSFAVTVPQAILFTLDFSKKYNLEWSYDLKKKKWFIDFIESSKKAKSVKLKTALWKRSQRSYATTIPQSVLVYINEQKKHIVEWDFDSEMQKWNVAVKESDADE